MADGVTPVPYGDVTQRVGVEVIRAPGVDVDLLIKKLIANAARARRRRQIVERLRADGHSIQFVAEFDPELGTKLCSLRAAR